MSKPVQEIYEIDPDEPQHGRGHLSSNGHWIFGSIYACLTLIGFVFGVWAGAAKPKPTETAEVKKEPAEKAPVQPQHDLGASPAPASPEPVFVEPKLEPRTEPKPKTEPKSDPKPKPETKPAPKPKDAPPKVRQVAFKEIQPIITTYCGNCHGLAGKPKADIDLRTVASIMKGGTSGDIVKAGDPMNSKLYTSLLPGASEPMPPDGKPAPTQKDIMLIRDWIASGAKP
jgi:hypothetical protein